MLSSQQLFATMDYAYIALTMCYLFVLYITYLNLMSTL